MKINYNYFNCLIIKFIRSLHCYFNCISYIFHFHIWEQLSLLISQHIINTRRPLFPIDHPPDCSVAPVHSHLHTLTHSHSWTFPYFIWPFKTTICIITNYILWSPWVFCLFLFVVIDNSDVNVTVFWFNNFNVKSEFPFESDLWHKHKLPIISIIFCHFC